MGSGGGLGDGDGEAGRPGEEARPPPDAVEALQGIDGLPAEAKRRHSACFFSDLIGPFF